MAGVAELFFAGCLLAALCAWLFMPDHGDPTRIARFGKWPAIITVAAIGIVGFSDDRFRPSQHQNEGEVIILPRAADGHFYAQLVLNNTPVAFLIDTGASEVVLSKDDARRIGLNPESLTFFGSASTANGTVSTAPAVVEEVRFERIEDYNMRVSVNGGELHESLLGMSYLNRFSSIELRDGTMQLTR